MLSNPLDKEYLLFNLDDIETEDHDLYQGIKIIALP